MAVEETAAKLREAEAACETHEAPQAELKKKWKERLKKVIEEVTANNDTILFLDEMHTLVGAGAAEGAIDAANLLQPARSRSVPQGRL